MDGPQDFGAVSPIADDISSVGVESHSSLGKLDAETDEEDNLSAEIDAALARASEGAGGVLMQRNAGGGGKSISKASGEDVGGGGTRKKLLEDLSFQLTLQPEEAIRRNEVERTALEVQLEHQRWVHKNELEKERKMHAEAVATLKQEMDRKLLTHYDMAKDLQSIKISLGDFSLSEKNYEELRSRKEEALSLREYVLLKVHNVKKDREKRIQALEREKEEAQTAKQETLLKLERTEAGLARLEQSRDGLQADYALLREQSSAQITKLTEELSSLQQSKDSVESRSRVLAQLEQNTRRLEDDLHASKREAAKLESRLAEAQIDVVKNQEKANELDTKLCLSQQQESSLVKQVSLLEIANEKLQGDLDATLSRLDSAKEKKRDLVRKFELEKGKDTLDLQERIDAEVSRLKEQMEMDVGRIRSNLVELHAKEVALLKERVHYVEGERERLSRKLQDEEHRSQELQVSLTNTHSRLSNEITELKGVSRLRHFEVEKYSLSYEETLQALNKETQENEVLKKKVELLTKEYYEMEVRLKKEHAGTEMENVTLKEQLKSYTDMELELNGALKDISEYRDPAIGNAVPSSVEDALILGATLSGAPSQARRRIQESLLLAQQLQRKGKELADARGELEVEREKVRALQKAKMLAEQAKEWHDEPRHYLVEQLREKEGEILDLRRSQELLEREYETLKDRFVELQDRGRETEADLKAILTQREQLEYLKQQAPQREQLEFMKQSGASSAFIPRSDGVKLSQVPAKVAWFDNLRSAK
ncbi:unnamed protein product [Amoebophrya sp. A25]|nr:unnamed protein product [Amoebophrya sp. A25]|eukprot:GSA25T00008473001.1